MRRAAATLVIVCIGAQPGCALVSPGARGYYVPVAEGLTAPSVTEAMSIAVPTLGAFQLTGACHVPRRVARLEAAARVVPLRVGDRLALSALRVVGIGEANVALPAVPVAIEAEEHVPPIVQWRGDDPEVNAGRFLVVSSGRSRVRVRTLCANSPAEIVITAVVAP